MCVGEGVGVGVDGVERSFSQLFRRKCSIEASARREE